METSAPFDLNQSVGQWRANLQNLGGLRIEELDELEGHLHESISALHAKGLPMPEAFIISARRLGTERQLSGEFAKANPQRLWTERALWMVAGVLVAHAVIVVVGPSLATLTNCAWSSGLDARLLVALSFLAHWVAWTGGAAMAYWILCRQSSWRDRVVEAAIRSPVLIGVGLFTVLEYVRYLMSDVGRYAEPVYKLFNGHDVVPAPQTIASIGAWFFWGNLLTQLLWIAAGPILAGYAWRKRGSLAADSTMHQELQPGEQEAARTLQSQGLTHDEAGLVLARRRCSREVVAPALARVPDQAIWLERAVWMVTGIALSRFLVPLVLELAWIVSATSRPAAPLFQHVAGFTSLCLGPALAAAMFAGLWRWIVQHPSQSASIGRICRLRPVLAAAGLIMVYASISCCWYILPRYVIRPAPRGIGPIGSQWMQYGLPLAQVIIPIILLLWLARRWRGMQTSPALFR